ncbi:MAG: ABC-2 family transporter protein [Candidatus Eisenbacteria bacterium]|uniref:ABC-2 family transporter protein n=1 Tax=Eiseniibacteriota bacterium TaxID=2212470 RepID=A0A956M1A6_UNCEI|nr:ABC-2 family transporter protein [Candidatus Eisenbacteria bacterium]
MRSWLSAYPAFLRISLLASIQYRASGAIWMIGSILEPLVYLTVWSTVARSQGGTVGGYSTAEFAAYYTALLLVNHMTFTWIMHEFQYRIQYGSFSFALLRPIHPIHADIAENLAFKAVQLAVILPAFVVLCLGFRPHFELSAWSLALFVPVLFCGFLLRFFLEWTLAMAAFWTTRVTAMNQIYFSLQMFLSGRVAPIALLPLWISDVARHLPFYYAIGFPVEIALGRLTPDQAWRGALLQLGWLALMGTTIALVWRRAARRFTAVGS